MTATAPRVQPAIDAKDFEKLRYAPAWFAELEPTPATAEEHLNEAQYVEALGLKSVHFTLSSYAKKGPAPIKFMSAVGIHRKDDQWLSRCFNVRPPAARPASSPTGKDANAEGGAAQDTTGKSTQAQAGGAQAGAVGAPGSGMPHKVPPKPIRPPAFVSWRPINIAETLSLLLNQISDEQQVAEKAQVDAKREEEARARKRAKDREDEAARKDKEGVQAVLARRRGRLVFWVIGSSAALAVGLAIMLMVWRR